MKKVSISSEVKIAQRIFIVRGEKIIMDFDLAIMYQVETKYLKRQVRRNISRFPPDFMFKLTASEYKIIRSQNGTIEISGQGKFSKYLPMAFSEQGVAMLSGLLNAPRAIKINISIMRAFVRLRKLIDANRTLADKIDKLERKFKTNTKKQVQKFDLVFKAIRQLMVTPNPPRQKIGY